jgi:hypothetical protein
MSILMLVSHPRQGLSSADIADAIKQGGEGHELQASCDAYAFDADQIRSGYHVVVIGPVGRIMAAAKSAHDQQVPFETTDVTEALSAPVLIVDVTTVMPPTSMIGAGRPFPSMVGDGSSTSTPARSPDPMALPDGATGIVLRSSDKKDGQPVVIKAIDQSSSFSRVDPGAFHWRSALPGQGSAMWGAVNQASYTYLFDLAEFRAMPDADIEIVLMTSANPAGGYSCKIGSKNRTELR